MISSRLKCLRQEKQIVHRFHDQWKNYFLQSEEKAKSILQILWIMTVQNRYLFLDTGSEENSSSKHIHWMPVRIQTKIYVFEKFVFSPEKGM